MSLTVEVSLISGKAVSLQTHVGRIRGIAEGASH